MPQNDIRGICIFNSAHEGYRRAGVAFNAGENLFASNVFTDSQLSQIDSDPRLTVRPYPEDDTPDSSSGAMDASDLSKCVDESLIKAISQLDLNVPGHFTQDGKPDTKALSSLLKRKVSAKERDSAWANIQANADNEQIE